MDSKVQELASLLCVSPRRARLALDAASGSMDRAAELILSGSVQVFSTSTPQQTVVASSTSTASTPAILGKDEQLKLDEEYARRIAQMEEDAHRYQIDADARLASKIESEERRKSLSPLPSSHHASASNANTGRPRGSSLSPVPSCANKASTASVPKKSQENAAVWVGLGTPPPGGLPEPLAPVAALTNNGVVGSASRPPTGAASLISAVPLAASVSAATAASSSSITATTANVGLEDWSALFANNNNNNGASKPATSSADFSNVPPSQPFATLNNNNNNNSSFNNTTNNHFGNNSIQQPFSGLPTASSSHSLARAATVGSFFSAEDPSPASTCSSSKSFPLQQQQRHSSSSQAPFFFHPQQENNNSRSNSDLHQRSMSFSHLERQSSDLISWDEQSDENPTSSAASVSSSVAGGGGGGGAGASSISLTATPMRRAAETGLASPTSLMDALDFIGGGGGGGARGGGDSLLPSVLDFSLGGNGGLNATGGGGNLLEASSLSSVHLFTDDDWSFLDNAASEQKSSAAASKPKEEGVVAGGSNESGKNGVKSEADRVREEILTTEKTYVERLKKLQAFFERGEVKDALKVLEQPLGVGQKDVENILRTSEKLLQSLQEAATTAAVATCFKTFAPFFKINTYYLNNLNLQAIAGLRGKGWLLEFNSLLAEPMQRLPRYVLLLDRLSKSDPGCGMAKEALTRVSQIVASVNEKLEEWDRKRKVLSIQNKMEGMPHLLRVVEPHRMFIGQCQVQLTHVKGGDEPLYSSSSATNSATSAAGGGGGGGGGGAGASSSATPSASTSAVVVAATPASSEQQQQQQQQQQIPLTCFVFNDVLLFAQQRKAGEEFRFVERIDLRGMSPPTAIFANPPPSLLLTTPSPPAATPSLSTTMTSAIATPSTSSSSSSSSTATTTNASSSTSSSDSSTFAPSVDILGIRLESCCRHRQWLIEQPGSGGSGSSRNSATATCSLSSVTSVSNMVAATSTPASSVVTASIGAGDRSSSAVSRRASGIGSLAKGASDQGMWWIWDVARVNAMSDEAKRKSWDRLRLKQGRMHMQCFKRKLGNHNATLPHLPDDRWREWWFVLKGGELHWYRQQPNNKGFNEAPSGILPLKNCFYMEIERSRGLVFQCFHPGRRGHVFRISSLQSGLCWLAALRLASDAASRGEVGDGICMHEFVENDSNMVFPHDCTVCSKRVSDGGYKCAACKIYVHNECLPVAPVDCGPVSSVLAKSKDR